MLRQRFGQADAVEYLRELNGHRELLKKLTRLHAEVEKAHAIRKAEAQKLALAERTHAAALTENAKLKDHCAAMQRALQKYQLRSSREVLNLKADREKKAKEVERLEATLVQRERDLRLQQATVMKLKGNLEKLIERYHKLKAAANSQVSSASQVLSTLIEPNKSPSASHANISPVSSASAFSKASPEKRDAEPVEPADGAFVTQPKGGAFADDGFMQEPLAFTVGDKTVVPGIDEAVRGMAPGGIRRIIVPEEIGYPKDGFKSVGPRPSTFSGERALDFGTIDLPDSMDHTLRLQRIYDRILELADEHKPDERRGVHDARPCTVLWHERPPILPRAWMTPTARTTKIDDVTKRLARTGRSQVAPWQPAFRETAIPVFHELTTT